MRTNGLQQLQMLYSRDEEKIFLFSQEVAGVLWPNDQDTAPLSKICERLLSRLVALKVHDQHKCVNSYTEQLCHRHVRLHCMWNIPQRPPRILYSTSDKSVDS